MKENFLVLNFLDDCFEVNALKIDFTTKSMILLSQSEENYGFDKFKKVLSSAFPLKKYDTILSLDSKRAYTNYQNVSLIRDNPAEKISEADIENLISQALWKIYDEGRKASSKQLGLSDLETLLVDTRVYDFRIDNREVINPLGHNGEKIDIYLSQTFTNRSFLDEITKILPKRARLAFVVESGAAASNLISRINNDEKFLFARVMRGETDLFLVDKIKKTQSKKLKKGTIKALGDAGSRINYLDYFSWGTNHLYKEIGDELKIPEEVAEKVIRKFFKNNMSETYSRHFGGIFLEKSAILFKGLSNALALAKCDSVYLDFPVLGRGALQNWKIFPKMIVPITSAHTSRIFGFEEESVPIGQTETGLDFLALSAIMEYYFLPKEDLVNRLARRRMRWLMA